MNRLPILLLLILFSCNKKKIEIKNGFEKIDKKMLDNKVLIKKIVPDNTYSFWQYTNIRGGLSKGDEITEMKFGDTLLLKKK